MGNNYKEKSLKDLINLEGKEFKIPGLKENPFSDPKIKKIYSQLDDASSESIMRSRVDWRYIKGYTFQ